MPFCIMKPSGCSVGDAPVGRLQGYDTSAFAHNFALLTGHPFYNLEGEFFLFVLGGKFIFVKIVSIGGKLEVSPYIG